MLQFAQLSKIFVEATVQTRFLQVEILQRLFVLEKVLTMAGNGRSFFGIGGNLREQCGFESKAAIQTPAGFGKGLHQFLFAQALRLVFVTVGLDVLHEGSGIVRRKQNGTSCQTCFESILRRDLIAIFRVFLNELGLQDPHGKAVSLANQLAERNFILCYAGANRFSFVHRTFLEYFCAAWFVERFEKRQTLTLEQLKTEVFECHWKDETWHEVLRLIAGMVGEKKAEELICFLMKQDGRFDKLANLLLAGECLGEVRNRQSVRKTDEAAWLKIIEQGVRYDPPHYYNPMVEYQQSGTTREKFVALLAVVSHNARTRHWLRSAGERNIDRIVGAAAVQELARGWKDDPETLSIAEGARPLR